MWRAVRGRTRGAGGEKKRRRERKRRKGRNGGKAKGVCRVSRTVALWEVTVLLLRRHHGPVSGESGPLFAITPTPGEISHIARLACWGLKCQSRREVFKLGLLRGTRGNSSSSSDGSRPAKRGTALTGTHANRHDSLQRHDNRNTRTAALRRHARMHAHTKSARFLAE